MSEGEWQSAQPMLLKAADPFCVEVVGAAGAGGADKRANAAKFTMSEDISEAVPLELPEPFCMFVASSGEPLKTQPGTAERSLGNSSLATPCSTL